MDLSSTNQASAEKYYIPIWLQLRRSILRGVFRQVFHVLCNVEINGRENIPEFGSYIIAHNHISLFEPPFVLAFWPEIAEGIAGADVFDRPVQKFFVKAYGAIPVRRGEYDRKVIDTMMDVLRGGKPLMIAPEGGRSHATALRRAQAGVAYLVDRAKVPVLPVGISGTTDDMLSRAIRGQRPTIRMNIGKAFSPSPIEGRGEMRRLARQKNADIVMEQIAKLIPADYRGYYA
jgi:1-acyl-sn-glycerol-3-phosphate acyltransferase